MLYFQRVKQFRNLKSKLFHPLKIQHLLGVTKLVLINFINTPADWLYDKAYSLPFNTLHNEKLTISLFAG